MGNLEALLLNIQEAKRTDQQRSVAANVENSDGLLSVNAPLKFITKWRQYSGQDFAFRLLF